MKDWDTYRFILALERSKTLRGAAEQLGVNHSTVSRKLAWLNSCQSEPLFERHQKSYQITEYGRHWLETAEHIETLALSAERKQRARSQELSGKVSLSVSPPIAQYMLGEALSTFSQHYPNIELTIDASEINVDLDRSEVDVVVRTTNDPPEHLVGRRLFPYAVCYYAQKDYFYRTPSENLNWIGTDTDPKHPDWVKGTPYPDAPVTVRTTGYQMRFLALATGMGLSRGACFMADGHPDLLRLPQSEPFLTMELWILTHPDLRDSPRIKAVMTYLVEAIEAKKALIQGTSV